MRRHTTARLRPFVTATLASVLTLLVTAASVLADGGGIPYPK